MSRVYAITNQKGGVGKTTTAVNLGTCLAQIGKKILVIDSDPQGNATSGLGLNKNEIRKCLYDVLISEIPITDVILPTQVQGLWAVPSTIKLAGAEAELVGMMSRDRAAPGPRTHPRRLRFYPDRLPPSLG